MDRMWSSNCSFLLPFLLLSAISHSLLSTLRGNAIGLLARQMRETTLL